MVYKTPQQTVPVFWILPIYVLGAASEVFAVLASFEFAYTKAPGGMKSLITSLNLLSCSLGSAVGFALSPTSTYHKGHGGVRRAQRAHGAHGGGVPSALLWVQ